MPGKSHKSQPTDEEMALLHDNTVSPRDDRRIRGKLLREAVPRESHGEWKAAADRPDPVDMLEEGNIGRIQHLIPIRYGRMLQTPFTFFRGAAALMARDLSYTPNSKVRVQACGDCHLMNFGAFATPERNVVFDLNDFDETLPAPWEWDIKRLSTSFVLACRDNGLKPKTEIAAAESVAQGYREKMASMSKLSIMDIWYEQIPWESIIAKTGDAELMKRRQEQLKKARKRTIQLYYYPKLVESGGGKYKIKDNPPLIFHPPEVENDVFLEKIKGSLLEYRNTLQWDKQRLFDRYKLVDFAIKVVGIGSVGTTCGILLFIGPDDDPLLLQVKEARPSVLEPYVGKSAFANNGERVVAGQRIVQAASDIFLGWTRSDEGKDFYIRQLRDTKVKLEPQFWDAKEMVATAKLMGEVLARSHARSGDAAVISGYLGNGAEFDRAIGQFSAVYADQSEKDFNALSAAVESGRVSAVKVEAT